MARTIIEGYDESAKSPQDLGRFGDNVTFRNARLRMDPAIGYSAGGQAPAAGYFRSRRNLTFEGLELIGWPDPLSAHYNSPFVWGSAGLRFEGCTGVQMTRVTVEGMPMDGIAFEGCSSVTLDGLWGRDCARALFVRKCKSFALSRLTLGSTRGIGPIDDTPAPVTSNRGRSVLYPDRWVHSDALIFEGIDGMTLDRIQHSGEGPGAIKLSNGRHVRITRFEGAHIQLFSDTTPGTPALEDVVLGSPDPGQWFVLDPDRGHQGRDYLLQLMGLLVGGANTVGPVQIQGATLFAPRPGLMRSNPSHPDWRHACLEADSTAAIRASGCRFLDRHQGAPEPIWTYGAGSVETVDCSFERLAISGGA